jgi:DNA repair photolyase
MLRYLVPTGDRTRDAQLRRLALIADQRALTMRGIDLWTGCNFGCRYCNPVGRRFAKMAGPMPPGEGLHQSQVRPRTGDPMNLVQLRRTPRARDGRGLPAYFSLMSDPYPAQEEREGVTRVAIATLHDYGVGVHLLTKSGARAVRDFQAAPGAGGGAGAPDLGSHADDAFGASITFLDEAQSHECEPRAASPAERMAGLEEAHRRGIATVLALGPVIEPEQTLQLIRLTRRYVDLVVVTPLTGENGVVDTPFDWSKFARQVITLAWRLQVSCCVNESSPEQASGMADAVGTVEKYMCPQLWLRICRARKPDWTR